MSEYVVEPDDPMDIPESIRSCSRCGSKKGTNVWVHRNNRTTITLCDEHVPDHVPGLLRNDWTRVWFRSDINEIEEPKRKARLKKEAVQ